MSNPYQSSFQPAENPDAKAVVQGPAISLIVVSLIALIVGTLALVIDAILIFTGVVAKLEVMNEGSISVYTKVAVRGIWGVVLIFASSFVLYGAMQMRKMRSFDTVRAAALVAMIPLLGPCCILGIPFGIWALVVLGKPGVKEAFTDQT